MTAAEIRAEIARIEDQIADWSLRFPMGFAEEELREQIAALNGDLNEIEDETAPVVEQKEAA